MSGSGSDTSETTTISSFDLDKLSKRDRVATLVVIHGPELGTRFQLEPGRFVVGRSGTADINLADSSLSREHFEIVTEEGHEVPRCRLRDLHSTNGTYIAGSRVEQAELHDGDPIRAGEVVLRFSLMDPLEDSFHREMSALIRHDSLTGLLKIAAFYEELGECERRVGSISSVFRTAGK
jgi:predicted component of type VI protein secretion system